MKKILKKANEKLDQIVEEECGPAPEPKPKPQAPPKPTFVGLVVGAVLALAACTPTVELIPAVPSCDEPAPWCTEAGR